MGLGRDDLLSCSAKSFAYKCSERVGIYKQDLEFAGAIYVPHKFTKVVVNYFTL